MYTEKALEDTVFYGPVVFTCDVKSRVPCGIRRLTTESDAQVVYSVVELDHLDRPTQHLEQIIDRHGPLIAVDPRAK